MLLDLKKLGKHEGKIPSSIATCLDFVSIWGTEGPNRAHLGRLCAAAIAVSVDHKRVLPAYPVTSGDPIAYGYKILDRLLKFMKFIELCPRIESHWPEAFKHYNSTGSLPETCNQCVSLSP